MISKSSDSKSSDSASKLRKSHAEQTSDGFGTLTHKIQQMKKQILADRVVSITEKVNENRKKLEGHVSLLESVATSRNDVSVVDANCQAKMLSSRIENPLCKFSGFALGLGDKDCVNIQEVVYSASTNLPYIEKIPPYTTWIFLDRNQRMAEDQSVVGRRRIYYDAHGSEALICSDSEEEIAEPDEEKHVFSKGEDRILWMTSQEHGLGEEVLNIVSQYVGGTTSEIQERCNMLKEKNQEKHNRRFKGCEENGSEKNYILEKSLSAALDSFDNLFCRRCLVFDCRLHGCSQSLINSEKQPYSSESDDDGNPCSDQCYLRLKVGKDLPEGSAVNYLRRLGSRSSGEEGRTPTSPSAEEAAMHHEMGKRKVPKNTTELPEKLTLVSDDIQGSFKKQKRAQSAGTLDCEGFLTVDSCSSEEGRNAESGKPDNNESLVFAKSQSESSSDKFSCALSVPGQGVEDSARCKAQGISHCAEVPVLKEWKPLEKELYLKGVEIFGRNSCLISRNLLSGLKTCIEVSSYMYDDEAGMPRGAVGMPTSFSEDKKKLDADFMEREIPRSRLFRRRGRTRKLKYSWKSAGHPSIWKRIADGKNQSCKQYIPCGCQPMCGKQCPCLHNGTCCEKYCGCSKSCKNRFRGCHCAKSQCRSRQCPCFAAGRECDPDVCRNCWVSCGDGSLDGPPKRGDGQCGNMRLLLRQQQRILLAKSEVAGWGAFLKNPVNKNDYLGEYTGELISHREADKRGKIYDRANSSFLFDLNDQYVLDAYRKGDKLKFANHSSNPNCYAKVMLVAGDHRVGIFAKEHIEASEELFYDYRYGPDQAPAWARKPDGWKGDDSSISNGRAKKHQSH
ncbi:LOW QUALITY PROTEIN: histone-lysine N-methyltransferase EZA1 [Actinidia eriantha]|uniref:LOW QUALITY PROTEIN: histone-lysine N-methyltransferase EZA1 n=1 Tax=Actinidia eriantha TaxID=165200 RepID=UPI00258D43D9|nr:LOW QUALITY PROTEIN: histone-lysine N-methyltransferase EZA1 [Actinidia eriantha]